MSKRFLAILVICILGLGAVFWFTQNKPSTENSSKNDAKSSLSNHVFGNNAAGVNLTEYGDFQCPACYSYEQIIAEVREKYKDQIHFQFRNFPLSIHQNARSAHRAAEAASNQGKFWEMHDLIYQSQDPEGKNGWAGSTNPYNDYFASFAKQIGLDASRFQTDFNSSQVNAVINADVAEGQRLGVNSTPTFLLQGKKIDEAPRDVAGFSKLIDDAIAEAKSKQN